MKKVRDVEKLLENTKFVIMMIVSFVLIGINLSASEIKFEKRYSQNISQEWEKNEDKKSTEKKYSRVIKNKNDLRKNLKDNLNDVETYYKNLYDQSPLTDDEWDSIKNTILTRADEIKRNKLSF